MNLKNPKTFDDNELLDDDTISDDFDTELNSGFDDYGGNEDVPMDKHQDLLKKLTDFEKFLKTYEHSLKGMVWSERGDKTTNNKPGFIKDKRIEPRTNERGAAWCISQLIVYTRDNNILTQLNTLTFNNMLDDIERDIYITLGVKFEEFNLKTIDNMLSLANNLINACILILSGAGGKDNYKSFLSTSSHRTESVNVDGYERRPVQQSNREGTFTKGMNYLFN